MFKLIKIIQKLFDDKIVTSIWYSKGKIWARKLNYSDACPAKDYYDMGSPEWQARVRILGRYRPWMIRLAAIWVAGAGLSFKEEISESFLYGNKYVDRSWSLDIAG